MLHRLVAGLAVPGGQQVEQQPASDGEAEPRLRSGVLVGKAEAVQQRHDGHQPVVDDALEQFDRPWTALQRLAVDLEEEPLVLCQLRGTEPLPEGAGDARGVQPVQLEVGERRARSISPCAQPVVSDRRFGYVHLRGLPVRDYRADVDLEPAAGGTRIHWQATFRPKTPGTGWLLRIGLRKFLQELTDNLASYAARTAA